MMLQPCPYVMVVAVATRPVNPCLPCASVRVERPHSPLLGTVPECLRSIQSSLDKIEETFDETLKTYMTNLQDRLLSA